MDMSDPLTADFPMRNIDQDEEKAALAGAATANRPPQIFWESGTASRLQAGKLKIKQLVFASNPASCRLLQHCCTAGQAAGAILHAEQTEGPGIALPTAADKVYMMYLLPDGPAQHTDVQQTGSGQTQQGSIEQPVSQLSLENIGQLPHSLVVFCQVELQSERATIWLQTLLQHMVPEHILVATSLPAFSYRGPGDPHEENLNYVVQTSAAADQSRGKLIVPSLPSGSLVTGLAAAALQHAEVRQLAATVLVSIDARPKPDIHSMQQLARNLEQVLTAYGSTIVQADSLSQAVKQA